MTIHVIDPDYPFGWLWLIIGMAAAVIALGIVLDAVWGLEEIGGYLFGLGIGVAVIGVFLVSLLGYGFERNKAVETAIEQAGFEHVQLSGDKFVAEYNGEFFNGYLLDLGGDDYKVVDLDD